MLWSRVKGFTKVLMIGGDDILGSWIQVMIKHLGENELSYVAWPHHSWMTKLFSYRSRGTDQYTYMCLISTLFKATWLQNQSQSCGKGSHKVFGPTPWPVQIQPLVQTRLLRSIFKQVSSLFSTELLFIHSTHSLHWYKSITDPRCRTLHFQLLDFMKLLVAHSCSLPRCFSVATLH